MPDIDFQKIVLNLIPKKGDKPVIFYASQYETARLFIADFMWGESEYAPGVDCWVEIDIRKNDDNLVVITDDVSIDNNEVSVILPVQALTCIGKNLGQVKIYAADDQLVAALNFILEVQADPLAGGVTSETAIDNLTEQIEEITQQVIGDDYYNKTEVDDLLDDKADKATTYTKTQTDTLLNAKANVSDLATVATTGDYDDLLNKPTIPAAQVQSDYAQADNTQVDYIKNKPDIDAMIANALLAVMPVGTASGPIANFDTELAVPLVNVSCNIEATGGNGTPDNPNPINGYTEANITANGDVITIAFGQTVYGGVLDVTRGKLHVTHGSTELSKDWNWRKSGSYDGAFYVFISEVPSLNAKTYNPFTCTHLTSVNDISNYVFGTSYCDAAMNFFIMPTGSILQDFKDYIDAQALANTPIRILYELDTPFDIDLTPEVISAVVGENNVYSDTNGDTTVQYKDSIQHYIDQRV